MSKTASQLMWKVVGLSLVLCVSACTKHPVPRTKVSYGAVTDAPVERSSVPEEWRPAKDTPVLKPPVQPVNQAQLREVKNRAEDSPAPLRASNLSNSNNPPATEHGWLPLGKPTVELSAPAGAAVPYVTAEQRAQKLRDELRTNAQSSTAWKE